MSDQEIEIKFLDIDKNDLMRKLKQAGASDLGEDLLKEIIFYDQNLTWKNDRHKLVRFVRLRSNSKGVFLTYKSQSQQGEVPYAEEIEFKVSDMDKAEEILKAVGLIAYRHQEKKRHSYKLEEVMIDIDTWPQVPPYVETEGPSEAEVKKVAERLGFDWDQGVFEVSGRIIEKYYHIQIGELKYFTFEEVR